jgi:hypothetical protein
VFSTCMHGHAAWNEAKRVAAGTALCGDMHHHVRVGGRTVAAACGISEAGGGKCKTHQACGLGEQAGQTSASRQDLASGCPGASHALKIAFVSAGGLLYLFGGPGWSIENRLEVTGRCSVQVVWHGRKTGCASNGD